VDGLLQLKPQMFTSEFVQQVILPTGQDEPHWITALVNFGSSLANGHIAVWNTVFATVQIAIGLALILSFRVKTAIVASILWSLIVWVFGEGLGQLFTGQSLLLTGAPGAAVVYGLISGAVWPNGEKSAREWTSQGIRFARYSLAGLFLLGGVLDLQGAYLTPTAFGQSIAWPWLASLIGSHGAAASIALGLIEFVIGVLLASPVRTRGVVWVSIVLSFLFWWAGQSFGQVFDPLATDFNTGLLMILLALAAYPQLFTGRAIENSVTHSRESARLAR
jgi:hypothetical protein